MVDEKVVFVEDNVVVKYDVLLVFEVKWCDV